RLELQLPRVADVDDGGPFPLDLAFVLRGELPRALRLDLPVEERACSAAVFGVLRRGQERFPGELERVLTENRGVLSLHRLQFGGLLLSRIGQVVLARDLFHEGFAVAAKPIERHGHADRRSSMMAPTRSAAMRSWRSVSRSRTVTVPSSAVCPSTVTQNGV